MTRRFVRLTSYHTTAGLIETNFQNLISSKTRTIGELIRFSPSNYEGIMKIIGFGKKNLSVDLSEVLRLEVVKFKRLI